MCCLTVPSSDTSNSKAREVAGRGAKRGKWRGAGQRLPNRQPVTRTGVPIGVNGQIFLALAGWISTQPLLCGKPYDARG